jgi:hypothetical protein
MGLDLAAATGIPLMEWRCDRWHPVTLRGKRAVGISERVCRENGRELVAHVIGSDDGNWYAYAAVRTQRGVGGSWRVGRAWRSMKTARAAAERFVARKMEAV